MKKSMIAYLLVMVLIVSNIGLAFAASDGNKNEYKIPEGQVVQPAIDFWKQAKEDSLKDKNWVIGGFKATACDFMIMSAQSELKYEQNINIVTDSSASTGRRIGSGLGIAWHVGTSIAKALQLKPNFGAQGGTNAIVSLGGGTKITLPGNSPAIGLFTDVKYVPITKITYGNALFKFPLGSAPTDVIGKPDDINLVIKTLPIMKSLASYVFQNQGSNSKSVDSNNINEISESPSSTSVTSIETSNTPYSFNYLGLNDASQNLISNSNSMVSDPTSSSYSPVTNPTSSSYSPSSLDNPMSTYSPMTDPTSSSYSSVNNPISSSYSPISSYNDPASYSFSKYNPTYSLGQDIYSSSITPLSEYSPYTVYDSYMDYNNPDYSSSLSSYPDSFQDSSNDYLQAYDPDSLSDYSSDSLDYLSSSPIDSSLDSWTSSLDDNFDTFQASLYDSNPILSSESYSYDLLDDTGSPTSYASSNLYSTGSSLDSSGSSLDSSGSSLYSTNYASESYMDSAFMSDSLDTPLVDSFEETNSMYSPSSYDSSLDPSSTSSSTDYGSYVMDSVIDTSISSSSIQFSNDFYMTPSVFYNPMSTYYMPGGITMGPMNSYSGINSYSGMSSFYSISSYSSPSYFNSFTTSSYNSFSSPSYYSSFSTPSYSSYSSFSTPSYSSYSSFSTPSYSSFSTPSTSFSSP